MEYPSLLKDPAIFPDETVLKKVLGKGYDPYIALLELYKHNGIVWEWRYYNDGKLWLCKVTKKTKTIVWMSAFEGFIRATIYFSAKYIDGIYELQISDDLKEHIRNTKNTGKSKGCTFEITTKNILKEFDIIMQYKLSIK